jgi:drug/metabolite transporter superfamily protein YnfA
LYLIKFPTFYSLPIACGLAFSVWGLYFWMRGRAPGHKCANYVAGSLCMALVAGCRPQLLLLSFLAFPLFWRAYISKRRICTKEGICEFICLIAPYLIVAAGIMLYNHARFGSFTDFGANYNLTVNDMTKRGWNIGRLAPAFFSYFLQPPNIVGVFPFIQAADFSTTYMGQTIKEVTFGGIFACLPILWVLLFVRPVVRLRNSQRSSRTISGVIITLLISGVVIALVDAEMAGILQRYYADFSFMFLAAAVLVIFVINENLLDVKAQQLATFKHPLEPGSPQFTRSAMTKVLMVLVAVSLVYSLLICFVPETGWYSDIYSWAYQNLIETFLFWT